MHQQVWPHRGRSTCACSGRVVRLCQCPAGRRFAFTAMIRSVGGVECIPAFAQVFACPQQVEHELPRIACGLYFGRVVPLITNRNSSYSVRWAAVSCNIGPAKQAKRPSIRPNRGISCFNSPVHRNLRSCTSGSSPELLGDILRPANVLYPRKA